MNFKPGMKIKHYKGGKYIVIGQGTHSETGEECIIYQNRADDRIWIRPIDMFYNMVEHKGKWVNRFEVDKTDMSIMSRLLKVDWGLVIIGFLLIYFFLS